MAGEALLASWNDTPTRQAIVDFVASVTTEGSDGFVPEPERIAVFDNDGTLWTEKPIPIQLDFTLFRMAEQATADPSLADRQPYQAAIAKDYQWLGAAMVKHYHGDDADMGLLTGRGLQGVRRDGGRGVRGGDPHVVRDRGAPAAAPAATSRAGSCR